VFRLATSPIAPLLGQRLPVRAQARLMHRSYLRMQRRTGQAERVLTTSAGDVFQADVATFQEWYRWVYGSLEEMAQLFACLVQPGARCVDVGAGIGLRTVRLAKLTGPAGEIIAVEPDPEKAGQAARNIALNELSNARIIPAEASDTSGAGVADLAGSPVPVPSVTIDEACPGPVALMTIDDGARPVAVMTGAAATIERDRPAIVFEYGPELLGGKSEDTFGRLAQTGYLLYQIGSRHNRLTARRSLRLYPMYTQPESDAACWRYPRTTRVGSSRLSRPATAAYDWTLPGEPAPGSELARRLH
jgi:FkbM family methyltransferase